MDTPVNEPAWQITSLPGRGGAALSHHAGRWVVVCRGGSVTGETLDEALRRALCSGAEAKRFPTSS